MLQTSGLAKRKPRTPNFLVCTSIHNSQPHSLITLTWQLIVASRSGRTEYQLLLMNVSWWDRNVKVIKDFGCDLWILVRKSFYQPNESIPRKIRSSSRFNVGGCISGSKTELSAGLCNRSDALGQIVWRLLTCTKAGIPRRRHGHRHRLWLGEEIACVGRKIVAVFGESVSVSVSVSALWNASISAQVDTVCTGYTLFNGQPVELPQRTLRPSTIVWKTGLRRPSLSAVHDQRYAAGVSGRTRYCSEAAADCGSVAPP